MKPILITEGHPAKQIRIDRKRWEVTAEEYDKCGVTEELCEADAVPKEADRKVDELEREKFTKVVGRHLVVLSHDMGGHEWWRPVDLFAVYGDEEFSPSIHEFRIHSRAQLVAMLRAEIARIQRTIKDLGV